MVSWEEWNTAFTVQAAELLAWAGSGPTLLEGMVVIDLRMMRESDNLLSQRALQKRWGYTRRRVIEVLAAHPPVDLQVPTPSEPAPLITMRWVPNEPPAAPDAAPELPTGLLDGLREMSESEGVAITSEVVAQMTPTAMLAIRSRFPWATLDEVRAALVLLADE